MKHSQRWLLALIVVSVAGSFVHAAVNGQWRVNLLRGSTTLSTEVGATEADAWKTCQARINGMLAGTFTYTCQTPRFVATIAPDAPPPPLPVDCVVSDWTTTTGEWSACANSMQTRSTTRTRAVTTPASNGGQACPALADSTVESRSCTVTPPPDPPPTGNLVYANPPTADAGVLKNGETLVLRAGVYTSLKLKACAADAWCTVKAETDGAAQFSGLDIGAGNWYTRLEGLKFTGSSTKTVTGSFVKFSRTSFSGGPATGNAVTLQLGTNDRTPGCSNILLEDSWVSGPGGRYKVLVYNCDKVVLRRVVVRHDGGWKYDSQNPQGGITIYDSTNVHAQDVMCVDSAQGLSGFEACIYLVSNGTTSTRAANNLVSGAIVIDSPNNGIAAEGNASATWSVQDAAVLRSAAGGFNTNGQGHLTITRAYANVKGAPFAAWNGSLSASSCIYRGGSNSGGSLTSCSSTLPPSITQPNALGQGASIQFRIGRDGTLFGDLGFEDLTTAPLWPWPNEERIKADFDAVRPAFGGKSLTDYVQGAAP